jgi:hypothetical protein
MAINLQALKSAPKKADKDHTNINATVKVQADGTIVITLPANIAETDLYESAAKDEKGQPKKTPMAYVQFKADAKGTVRFPVTVPASGDNPAYTVMLRASGFNAFVDSVS